MPKINVYLPDDLAAAVRDAQIPVSAVCQAALERAVRDVSALRSSDEAPASEETAYGAFSRFTGRARKSVMLAEGVARAHKHAYVGTEHLLLGVLEEGGNLALKVLHALDVEPGDVRAELTASLGPASDNDDGTTAPFTPLAKDALEQANKEALSAGQSSVGCEHLLLGLVAVEDGLASQVLRRMGVELRTTRRAVSTALQGFIHASEQHATQAAPDTISEVLRRIEAIEQRLADDDHPA
jgi:ATP-dependent Clp protease ATP-binding subunit ClpA/post-segregation antitoxin (ccd killing protein)